MSLAMQAGQRGLNGGVGASKVEVVEVEAVWLATVLILVDEFVVVDTHAGANALQQLVYLGIGRVRQAGIRVLVVGEATDDNSATVIDVVADNFDEAVFKRADNCLAGILARVLEAGRKSQAGPRLSGRRQ